MKRQADVKSLDALKDAKAALAEFREIVTVALSEANSEVQRTLWWLQHDQRTHWEHQARKRNEMLSMAKSELFRAQLNAQDSQASCLEQRKAVERAERGVEEARVKLDRLKQWTRKLDREVLLFKGKCQGLARAVETEVPRGEARLDLLMDRLEKYVRVPTQRTTTTKKSADDEA